MDGKGAAGDAGSARLVLPEHPAPGAALAGQEARAGMVLVWLHHGDNDGYLPGQR